ncbi:hypothetical protein PV409_37675 [Streptomyces sp. ME02-6979.5a]|uniref:hypothetical protein n=1 Tax=Streptomyces sp. ME02-6979.5a TaxID=462925 RepID=UPI0029B08826|nr:hypothetical protein [Streptomyces sp. ME02-6979.5a]MDX3343683.1 hypothetical protein [Streptomyces sp. ME02-6979.5a]
MRNPVGPLPSSIYWRRRAVAGLLVALLAVLIAWAVTSGGGGGGGRDDGKSGGSGPAKSIDPGPSGSGPAISQQPGGRDESDEEDGSGGSGESSGGSSDGSSTGGTDTGSGGSSGTDAGAGTAGSGGGGTAGQQVPAGSSLPDCTPAAVQLSLRTKVSYGPDDRPKFELIAKNTSSTTCKADFGPKNAVLTVTEAGGEDDDPIWSSKDCPAAAGALFLKVPAGATVVHTVDWNRTLSAPGCATPPAGRAGPGTYLLEAKAPGEPVQRASFVLTKD